VAVPLEIPNVEKADGKHRSFLEWKPYLFIDPQKTKFDQNCYTDLSPYYLNVVDSIQAMTLSSCKTVLRQSAQATQRFLRQNTLDLIAADELTSYSPDLNPLDYRTAFEISAGFDVRMSTTANQQDLKEAIKNK